MKRLLSLMLLCLTIVPATAETIKLEFDRDLSGWEEKVFNGKVDYSTVQVGDRLVLQGISNGNASALIRRQDIDPQKFSTIRWRWKISNILQKGHAGQKAGDDYPARIYIVFDSWLPNYARSINYIWASRVKRDSLIVSPYYKRSIMLAVNSGKERVGQWVTEERDLIEDYRRAFGDKIPMIKAVAIMTDGDDTEESATAWYDWIEFVSTGPDN